MAAAPSSKIPKVNVKEIDTRDWETKVKQQEELTINLSRDVEKYKKALEEAQEKKSDFWKILGEVLGGIGSSIIMGAGAGRGGASSGGRRVIRMDRPPL